LQVHLRYKRYKNDTFNKQILKWEINDDSSGISLCTIPDVLPSMVSTGFQGNINFNTLKSRQASDEKASPLAESNAPQQDTEKTQVQSDACKESSSDSVSHPINQEVLRGSEKASDEKDKPLTECNPPQQDTEKTQVQSDVCKESSSDIASHPINKDEELRESEKASDEKDSTLVESNPPQQDTEKTQVHSDVCKESSSDSISHPINQEELRGSEKASDEKDSPLTECNPPQQDTEKTQVQSDACKESSSDSASHPISQENMRGSEKASDEKGSPLTENNPPQQNRQEEKVQSDVAKDSKQSKVEKTKREVLFWISVVSEPS
jgi:hypothetical protein